MEALKWAILSARQGHGGEAKENRALLMQRLSAEEIAKAEQQADMFRPTELAGPPLETAPGPAEKMPRGVKKLQPTE